MRKHYIDNLKWLVIFIVVPLHAAQIYYPYLSHYVKGEAVEWIGTVFAAFEVWLMPLMFTISGMCAVYALRKKTSGAFVKSRFFGVILPLLSGLAFIVPFQSYAGRLWHTETDMGYFRHWLDYFAGPTDMTGYAGGFGLSQYWFLLYLAAASFAFIAVYVTVRRISKKDVSLNVPAPVLPFLFLFASAAEPIGNIMGYSFGYYTAFLLLGAFAAASDRVKCSLEKYWHVFLAAALCVMALYLYNVEAEIIDNYGGPVRSACAWMCTLAALGAAGRFFNGTGKLREFLSRISFGVYQFHQTGLAWCAYFIVGAGLPAGAEFLIILAASLASGTALTLILSRFKTASLLFGLKRG